MCAAQSLKAPAVVAVTLHLPELQVSLKAPAVVSGVTISQILSFSDLHFSFATTWACLSFCLFESLELQSTIKVPQEVALLLGQGPKACCPPDMDHRALRVLLLMLLQRLRPTSGPEVSSLRLMNSSASSHSRK